MSAARPTSVAVAVSLYRLALIAYPAEFRRGYGAEIARLFRDTCRDAHRRQGAVGVVAIGIAALADLIASALLERFFRRSAMSKQFIARCGLASMVSGGLWAVGGMDLENRGSFYTHATWHITLAIAALLSLVGLVGLYTRYGPSAGPLGQFGLLVADLGAFLVLIGNALEGFAGLSAGWVLFMLGMLALLVGMITFAAAMWSRRGLPRWSITPHLVSAIGMLLAVASSIAAEAIGLPMIEDKSVLGASIVVSLVGLFGLGWVTLGLCLWTQRGEALPPSTVA